MSTREQDVLRRVGEASTLIVVSLADGPKHGYALLQDVRQFAGVELGPVAVQLYSTAGHSQPSI